MHADALYVEFNGKPYSSMDTERCVVLFVKDIVLLDDLPAAGTQFFTCFTGTKVQIQPQQPYTLQTYRDMQQKKHMLRLVRRQARALRAALR